MKRNVKRFILTTLMAGFASMAIAATCDLPETYATTDGSSPNQQKQAVCHKGKKTLFLPPPAAQAHIQHGDTAGPCPTP
jgi:hypothetical protein